MHKDNSISIKLLQERIDKLHRVNPQAFNENDYSFGFDTWKSGTIILLLKLFPDNKDIIEQIKNIHLKRVDYNRTDALAYNLDACKDEAKEILKILIETLNNSHLTSNSSFWDILHPKVVNLAHSRFDNGYFADAISACLKEINTVVKNHVKHLTGDEYDGAKLMTKAFSADNPLITFEDVSTVNGKNIQVGYMKLFEGAIIGIRNPKAHSNLYPDETTTIHLLFIASFLFYKLDKAIILKN